MPIQRTASGTSLHWALSLVRRAQVLETSATLRQAVSQSTSRATCPPQWPSFRRVRKVSQRSHWKRRWRMSAWRRISCRRRKIFTGTNSFHSGLKISTGRNLVRRWCLCHWDPTYESACWSKRTVWWNSETFDLNKKVELFQTFQVWFTRED